MNKQLLKQVTKVGKKRVVMDEFKMVNYHEVALLKHFTFKTCKKSLQIKTRKTQNLRTFYIESILHYQVACCLFDTNTYK